MEDESCNFHSFDSISCSNLNTFKPISSLTSSSACILLTESSLLSTNFTANFLVCESHLSSILKRNTLRKRSKCCGIPVNLSTHSEKNEKSYRLKRNANRQLSAKQVEDVHAKCGIIIPVNTPICPSCRTKLLTATGDERKPNDANGKSNTEEEQEFLRPRHVLQIHCNDNESIPSSQEQLSQVSESSVCAVDRFGKLNEFLGACNLSPIKTLKDPFQTSSDRTKRRYVAKANECLSLLLETMCPGEGDSLKDAMFAKYSKSYISYDSPEIVTALIDSYMKAETSSVRQQLLSIISIHYNFQDIHSKVPSITKHKFYTAKKHAVEFGVGSAVPEIDSTREKVNSTKLEHFLDFVTSSNVIKDLPLGEKTLTLSTGELIQTPYIIRCLAPATIVKQYSQLCEEENYDAIGQSTMYKILSECSASVRKSFEGIDYYIAESGEAFRDLEEVVDKLQIPLNEKKKTIEELMKAKHYLKTDYKMHVKTSSNVADHCFIHALSQAGSISFEQECSHDHTHQCIQCNQLDETLASILKMANDMEWDNPEAYLFKVEKAINSIMNLKAHLLRTKNQDSARTDITQNLKEGQLFVVVDWAMKFLPRKFREGQTDWFGKRGINWHIAVCATKNHGEDYHIDTYVHILDSQTPQDSALTSALIIDTIKDMALHKTISEVYIWSDNAGCYKSTHMIQSLHQELPALVRFYNFCEAQDGKGPCDRKASHIKSSIKRFINEGNNVLDAAQMKKAIDTQQKGKYKVKVVSPVIDVDTEKANFKPISDISSLSNFEFSSNGLRVWRAHKVGPGKLIPWSNTSVQLLQLNVVHDWLEDIIPAVISQDEDEESEEENEPPRKKRKHPLHVFYCNNNTCDRSFKTMASLENHLILGDCSLHEEKSVIDKSKIIYQKKLADLNYTNKSFSSENTVVCEDPPKDVGWALKVKKPKSLFSEDQKLYLTEKFNIGKISGNKEDPAKVARDMPFVLMDGKRRFNREQYLTGVQVTSFFSRLAQKDKKGSKQDAGDFLAATADRKLFCLKENILSKL